MLVGLAIAMEAPTWLDIKAFEGLIPCPASEMRQHLPKKCLKYFFLKIPHDPSMYGFCVQQHLSPSDNRVPRDWGCAT